jgi:hypothetical protein
MATNSFFSNYNFFNEQQLIDDLVIESIQLYGVDTYYVSHSTVSFDHILNEDSLIIFDAAYHVDLYVKSVDGFQGDGDFLSKFGLQIRDTATFTIAYRTFERFVTRENVNITRPREGDLIYMPMNNKFFKITFVEHESVFYQTGALQVYDLKCELFEYSNERFETNIEEIDTHYDAYKTDDIVNLEVMFDVDPIAKNLFYEEKGNDIIDFSELDPFSEVIFLPADYNYSADSTKITADDSIITSDAV